MEIKMEQIIQGAGRGVRECTSKVETTTLLAISGDDTRLSHGSIPPFPTRNPKGRPCLESP